jgi:hypothetical protein
VAALPKSVGTEFEFNSKGEIQRILHVTAGYGKVAAIDNLLEELKVGSDRLVYVGDGSSDIHVMLHVNRRDGYTIAVSENKYLAPIAKRSILSENALAILIRVTPDGSQPVYLGNHFTLPNVPKTKVEAEFGGAYLLGEGSRSGAGTGARVFRTGHRLRPN